MDFFTKKVEVKNNLHLLFSCITKKILKVLMHAFLVYNHIKLTDKKKRKDEDAGLHMMGQLSTLGPV